MVNDETGEESPGGGVFVEVVEDELLVGEEEWEQTGHRGRRR